MARSAERIRQIQNARTEEEQSRIAERERVDAREPKRDERPGAPPPDPRQDEKRQAAPKDGFFRRPIVLVAGGAILLAAIIIGTMWWLESRHYETTDDAFIDAHIVRISPQIAGRILRVAVEDNQLVQPGQLLMEIDSADAQTRLQQAIAQEQQAETQLNQGQAQIRVAEASYQQALSATSGVAAQAQNAEREFARYRALKNLNPQAVAQQQYDQAETQARNAEAQREAAAKQTQGLAAQRVAAEAQLKGARAQINALKAQVEQARITLGYTRVTAPITGHIAQRNAAPGNYVSPGQQVMAIVPLQIWVTANFKETQLADVRVGQAVDIRADACPDAKIRGHVDSIQRGAGQAFSLLPAENATGNFVKVVQRVPVKIVLDSVPRDCPLGPGMSVEPSVKVR